METPKSTQEVLSLLRSFMESEDVSIYEKLNLWKVLTALRGPDDRNEQTKYATTSVIRHFVFGKSLGQVEAIQHPDAPALAKHRETLCTGDWFYSADHFTIHARCAFHTLGLAWTHVNEEKSP